MLKEEILRELEENRNRPVSGQSMAEKYRVSRNAVWKTVQALREEGYEISSVRNQGYTLCADCDILSREGILACLPEHCHTLPVFVFDSLDSTNNEAKRMLASGFTGTGLIVSGTQTRGRGRRGKTFYSPAGTGLYLSLIVQPEQRVEEIPRMTLAAAVAVFRAIRRLTGLEADLKWVNDLFRNGKKIGGILSEAVSDLETGEVADVVVGIGLNLKTEEFPEELAEVAGSVGGGCTRNALAAEIAAQFLELDLTEPNTWLKEYCAHCITPGQLPPELRRIAEGGIAE